MHRRLPRADSLPPETIGASATVRVVPRLPCDPGASPFHVKGLALRGLVRMIERRVPGGLDAFVDALDDPRLVPFVRQPFLAASRYDLLPMLPLNAHLARMLGTPLEALARAQGALQAKFDATHTYKSIVSSGSLVDLDQRVPRLGAQYYDFGGCGAALEGPGRLVVARSGMPAYMIRWFAPMHAAYLEEIVRRMGARTAEATAREPRQAPESPAARGFPLVDNETVVTFS